MLPTRKQAEKIARCVDGMDPQKAYILGLLYDIGRKFGGRHPVHASDGENIVDLEERMKHIKARYGSSPQEKWEYTLCLKDYFEEKTGESIYTLIQIVDAGE